MLQNQPLADQLALAESDQVRILVVGAGVAGTSFAGLQRRRGRHPVLIEREDEHAPDGYMIGMLPLGGNLLHTLDRYQEYLDASSPVGTYEMGDGRGRIIRSFAIGKLLAANGDYRGLERGALVDVISGDGAVTFGTTVAAIDNRPDAVTVTFSDGSLATFDVVVIADGIHSATRPLVQPASELSHFDSAWGGWVVWAPLGKQAPDTYTEYWGAGHFVGFYPVKGRTGVFVGGPREATEGGVSDFAAEIRQSGSLSERIEAALEALESDPDPFYWAFTDCRSERFCFGRTVLLGDAGAGFMPTAGIGAAMAMDSAAALDDELSRAGRDTVVVALELWERRQRSRVLAAQKNSRFLARIMFTKSRLVAWVIRKIVSVVSLKAVLGGILKVVERR